MPQKIVCGGCSEILYKGKGVELKPPDELIVQLNGKCPKCGKKLFFDVGGLSVSAKR